MFSWYSFAIDVSCDVNCATCACKAAMDLAAAAAAAWHSLRCAAYSSLTYQHHHRHGAEGNRERSIPQSSRSRVLTPGGCVPS